MVMLGLRPGTEFRAEQAWELRKFKQDGAKPSAACSGDTTLFQCILAEPLSGAPSTGTTQCLSPATNLLECCLCFRDLLQRGWPSPC